MAGPLGFLYVLMILICFYFILFHTDVMAPPWTTILHTARAGGTLRPGDDLNVEHLLT